MTLRMGKMKRTHLFVGMMTKRDYRTINEHLGMGQGLLLVAVFRGQIGVIWNIQIPTLVHCSWACSVCTLSSWYADWVFAQRLRL